MHCLNLMYVSHWQMFLTRSILSFIWRWATGKAGSRLRSPSFTLDKPLVEMMVQIVPAVFQVFTKSWKNVSDAFLEPQVWRRMNISCCLWQTVVQNVPAGSWLSLLLEATLYRPFKWHHPPKRIIFVFVLVLLPGWSLLVKPYLCVGCGKII